MKLKYIILISISLLVAVEASAQVFTGPTDVCKTINQTYTYSDDVTYTSAQWSVTSGGTIVSGSGLTRQINWTANGTITVSLYNGASLVSQGTLNVYVFETGTISGPGTVTQGNSATITKVDQYGGFQWEVSTDGVNWTGLGSTPALVHTPNQNSQYRLKLNSACKTRFSNTVSVTVVAPLIITVEGPTSIPLGVSTRLSVANNFYQYQWQKNGTDISGAILHYLDTSEPAQYSIKAKATAGSAWETSAAVTISSSLISQPTAISYKVTTSLKKEGLSPSSNFYSLQSHEVNQEVMYLDGHGRSLQQIAIGQTPNRKDLVVPVAYDHAGRNEIQYLPYATTVVNGQYKPTALKGPGPSGNYSTSEQRAFYQGSAGVATDAMPYTKSVFEQSPLSTIIEQGGVGSDLQPGSTHTIRSSILVSTSAYSDAALKNVRKWTPAGPNGMYDNLQLTIAQTIDENGNKVWQFTDKLGRTVLKRVQLEDTQEGVTTPFLETYFVYDIRGNLTVQVPPKAMALINGGTSWTTALRDEWCYLYNYDELNRLVEKKEPGVAPVYYAYDPLDRLVLTQDGNLRALNKWAFIKYDLKGRGIMTGLYLNTTHTTREAVQTNVLNNLYTSGAWYEERGTALHGYTNQSFPTQNSNATALEVYTISYFDSYDLDNNGSNDFSYTTEGLAGEGSPFRTFNMPTASKQLVLGTSNWLYSYVFYDKYGRVIQMRGNNHLSLTIDNLITNVYNENGTLKYSKTTHKGAGGTVVTVLQTPEYDHAGRVLRISQSLNGGAQQVVAAYVYNELGQLIDKKLHDTGGNTFLQSVDYRYTIQGWLKSINNSQLTVDSQNNDDVNDYFGLELIYTTAESGLSNTQYYNGNISAIKWKGQGTTGLNDQRSYKYSYDKSDRLKTATFQAYTGTAWTKEAGTLTEALTYDANGNIKTLQRHQNQRGLSGTTVTATAQAIDNLTYTYASGQGNKLTKVEDAATATGGFANGSTATTEYLYNTDGSQTKDDNKGISTITYNTLGKPQQVTFTDGRTVSYLYSAGGSKLRMTTVVNSVTTTTDYVGSFVYENNVLSYFGSPEGRIIKSGANYERQYSIADHQGNTRVVFSSATPAPEVKTANMEAASNSDFLNYPAGGNRSSLNLFDHTDAGTTYTYSNKLTGGYNSQLGVARSYKVYAGDKVKIEAWAKYQNPTSTSSNILNYASALLTAFGYTAPPVGETGTARSALDVWGGLVAGGNGGTSTGPKAFVNIIVFDKNYKLLDAAWEAVDPAANQVGVSPVIAHDYMMREYTAKEEGYVFMYVSNENATLVDVYFDDVVMTHTKSNVIQYNEYYPFGMNTANSWTRDNTTGNNFLYNAGSELNKTTSNYEMFFREYDPALGRMTSVDPVAGKYSSLTPYNYAFNTPVNLNDPSGADPYGRSTLRDWAANNRLDGGRIYQDADGGMYGSGVFGSAFIRYGPGDGGALTDLVDFMAAGALQARLRRGLEVTIDWARVEDGVHVLNFSSGQYLRIPTQQILDNVSLYKSVFGISSWGTSRENLYQDNFGNFAQKADDGSYLIPYTSKSFFPSTIRHPGDWGSSLSISGNVTLGGGLSFELGLAWDNDGESTWFFSIGPSIGFDASIGVLAKSYDAINHKIGFDVTDLEGYGSAFNIAIGPVDGTYGGNLDAYEWNPFNFGQTYLAPGAGASFGVPFGLTFETTYTWTFGTNGKR